MNSCWSPVELFQYLFRPELLNGQCHIFLSQIVNIESPDLEDYLTLFFATVAIELPIYYGFVRPRKKEILSFFLMIVMVNLATHPFITYILPPILEDGGFFEWQYTLIAESFAPMVEAILVVFFFRGQRSNLLLWSSALAANLTSWWTGTYFW